MAKERFVYRGNKRTVESVVRKSKQGGNMYDSYLASEVQMFKPKEGENIIRIMPPTWEDVEKYGDGWEVGIYLHYNVGPDDGSYLCLDKMKGESCPICEARRQTTDEDEQDALKPSFRCIAWVIDRDNEKAGPLVWSMPVTLFKDINARSIDKKHNTPILIDDPEEGFDVAFMREGADLRTKYTAVEVMRDPSPLQDDEKLQERWLNYITEHTLPDILQFYEPEHIEKVLFGKAERRKSDEPEEEEEAPATRRGVKPVEEEVEEETPRRSRRTAPEAEEEGETPPTRSSRRRALLEEPEDPPEEDPPFDTEEAEERPSRRPREAAEGASPTEQARARLQRLKPRSGRS